MAKELYSAPSRSGNRLCSPPGDDGSSEALVIPFVEVKRPNHDRVRELLAASEASGTWSNFGPASRRLEEVIGERLALPADRRAVACANGTVALHGLIQLHEHLAGRPLRWVVSAFTFHAQKQGPLAAAIVVDCDADGQLDLEELCALPAEDYDGIVVTRLFGAARRSERYVDWAARAGKVLLFDSATCFSSRDGDLPFGHRGHGDVFSFHHTKPLGFGEGGCVVVPAAAEPVFRSLINFGLYQGIETAGRSMNGKMSDVAAAFILDRLEDEDRIRRGHREQFARLAGCARSLGLQMLVDGEIAGCLPTLAPVVFPRPVPLERLAGLPVVLHKYYRPVAPRPRADALYARVVCLPCHPGMASLSDAELCRILASLARSSSEG